MFTHERNHNALVKPHKLVYERFVCAVYFVTSPGPSHKMLQQCASFLSTCVYLAPFIDIRLFLSLYIYIYIEREDTCSTYLHIYVLCVCAYIYIYIHIYLCIYIYIYVYMYGGFYAQCASFLSTCVYLSSSSSFVADLIRNNPNR